MSNNTLAEPITEKRTFNPGPAWYTYQPVPEFKNEAEIEAYWQTQWDRWVNGYWTPEGHYITGPHYFYMQECKLLLQDGSLIRPFWRDIDQMIFEAADRARKNNRSLFIVKRRECGLTSVFGGCFPHYYARIKKGCTINITSHTQKGVYNIFQDKIMPIQDEIHPDIAGSYLKDAGGSKVSTRNSVGLNLAMLSLNEYNRPVSRISKMLCYETAMSDKAVNNFSGTRAAYTFVDEAPLHVRLGALLRSLGPTLMKGTKKVGFMVLGGTVEDNISMESLVQIQDLWYNADNADMDTLFIPATMGMDEFMVNGHSDIEGAKEYLMAKREKLGRKADKADLRAEIKNYPIEIGEVFDAGGAGFWEEASLEIINSRIKAIQQDPSIIAIPVNIIVKETRNEIDHMPSKIEVDYDPHPDGKIIMLEKPKPHVQYVAGMDGIGIGTEIGNEEGSNFAFCVTKLWDPSDPGSSFSPVCLLTERPKKVEDSYRKSVNIIRLYNKYGWFKCVVPEANQGNAEFFTAYMTKEGLRELVHDRQDLSGKGYTKTNKKGQPMTNNARAWLAQMANYVIQKYGTRYNMLILLQNMLLAGVKNADECDAWLNSLFGFGGLDFDKPTELPPEYEIKYVRSVRWVGGRAVTHWDEVRVPIKRQDAGYRPTG